MMQKGAIYLYEKIILIRRNKRIHIFNTIHGMENTT